MPRRPSFENPAQAVELGGLLASTIGAVVEAQGRIDDYTMQRKRELEEAAEGGPSMSPLWYVFDKVAIEVELSATIRSLPEQSSATSHGVRGQPRLFCQTLSPAAVSLYGYEASAGLKIRLQLGPRTGPPLKDSKESAR